VLRRRASSPKKSSVWIVQVVGGVKITQVASCTVDGEGPDERAGATEQLVHIRVGRAQIPVGAGGGGRPLIHNNAASPGTRTLRSDTVQADAAPYAWILA